MTLLLWGGGVVSQTTPMYSQYRFDGLAINPAFAGANDALSFNFIHRSQWIGIENAPSTSTFLMHGPLWNNRIGLGLNLSADKVGIDSRFSLTGNYAYRFHFQKSILALGLN